MKITEIINEAHHSIAGTFKIGPWTIYFDSHALVSVAHKEVSLADFTNIVSYSCTLPDVYPTIPIGKGAYFQDVNTMISIYVTRLSRFELRVETVLPKTQIPKPPMFRRPVPPASFKDNKRVGATLASLKADSLVRGRDAVSQDMEKNLATPKNRAERRQLDKLMRRSR